MIGKPITLALTSTEPRTDGVVSIHTIHHVGRVWQLRLAPPERDVAGRGLTNKAHYVVLTGPRPFPPAGTFDECLALATHTDRIKCEGQSPVIVTVNDIQMGALQYFAAFLDDGRAEGDEKGEPAKEAVAPPRVDKPQGVVPGPQKTGRPNLL